MFISVIISVYNGGRTFQRCLEALGQTTYDRWECIVIDDGSDDGSGQLARDFGARVIPSEFARSGPGRARNLGAKIAAGTVLFFIDADVLVRPETVSHVAQIMGDPELDAVFGSYDDSPREKNFLSQYRNLLHHYVHQMSSPRASTFWSGCGAIRRELFLEMGGFDTGYARPSIEDIELGYRLKAAGRETRLEKTLLVCHMKRWTAGKMVITDIRDRAIPWTRLILSAGSLPDDLNLQTDQRISAAALFVGLGSLVLAPFSWIAAVGIGVPAFLILLYLNRHFYRFLLGKKGVLFTLAAVPWHWLYFLYSALSFAGCLFWYRLLKMNNPDYVKQETAPQPLSPRGGLAEESLELEDDLLG